MNVRHEKEYEGTTLFAKLVYLCDEFEPGLVYFSIIIWTLIWLKNNLLLSL